MSNPLEFFNFLKPLLLDNTLANPTPQNVLVSLSLAIGLLYLSSTVLNLILSILSALRPAKNLKRYGAWAVVTGATDGIGLGESFTAHSASHPSDLWNLYDVFSIREAAGEERPEDCPHLSICPCTCVALGTGSRCLSSPVRCMPLFVCLQRLAEAEAEVKKYNVDTKVVVADFSNTSPELYKTIQAALSGLDIGILVSVSDVYVLQ